MKHIGYVGTYDSKCSQGVYRFKFDDVTGKLTKPTSFYKTNGGKCVALTDEFVVVTREIPGKSGIALLDKNGTVLSEAFMERVSACFIGCRDKFVYTANYHDGVVMIYKIANQKLQLVKKLVNGSETGCHQVMCWRSNIFVPCLKLDCINIYDMGKNFLLTDKIVFSPGTGPRHGVFTTDERLYLVSELSNELFYYHLVQNNSWELISKMSFLPEQSATGSASAALRLSGDGRFIYISTRGSNLLSVFSIEGATPKMIQQISCGGDHPRDFLLSGNGEYLLVVNRLSNELISMKINKTTGMIGAIADRTEVHEGVGIALE